MAHGPETNPAAALGGAPQARVVIDTNAVLDWLVFRDPSMDLLSAAIEAGHLCWIATLPMRDELASVLARGLEGRAPPDEVPLWTTWQRLCRQVPPPAPLSPARRLLCTDPDDQMFIDLAMATGARWLVTRDRALLRLARRARLHGVSITTPTTLKLAPP
jgi:uncharacterized protein